MATELQIRVLNGEVGVEIATTLFTNPLDMIAVQDGGQLIWNVICIDDNTSPKPYSIWVESKASSGVELPTGYTYGGVMHYQDVWFVWGWKSNV